VIVQPTYSNPIEDMPIKTKNVTKTFEEMLEEELAKEQARNAPKVEERSSKIEESTKKVFLKRKESILNTDRKSTIQQSSAKKGGYKYYVDAIAASLSKKKQPTVEDSNKKFNDTINSKAGGYISGQNTARVQDSHNIDKDRNSLASKNLINFSDKKA
jgi:hypothetical protein